MRLTPKRKEALKAATLRWCNEIRVERKKKPLLALPRGKQLDPDTCPCGRATGLSISPYFGVDKKTKMNYRLPKAVQDFVVAFDGGAFPELDLEAK